MPRRATRSTTASTMVVVLPVPGPASTSSGPPACSTTRRCASSRRGGVRDRPWQPDETIGRRISVHLALHSSRRYRQSAALTALATPARQSHVDPRGAAGPGGAAACFSSSYRASAARSCPASNDPSACTTRHQATPPPHSRHDPADLPRAAERQELGYVAVRHNGAGRDRVDHVQYPVRIIIRAGSRPRPPSRTHPARWPAALVPRPRRPVTARPSVVAAAARRCVTRRWRRPVHPGGAEAAG